MGTDVDFCNSVTKEAVICGRKHYAYPDLYSSGYEAKFPPSDFEYPPHMDKIWGRREDGNTEWYGVDPIDKNWATHDEALVYFEFDQTLRTNKKYHEELIRFVRNNPDGKFRYLSDCFCDEMTEGNGWWWINEIEDEGDLLLAHITHEFSSGIGVEDIAKKHMLCLKTVEKVVNNTLFDDIKKGLEEAIEMAKTEVWQIDKDAEPHCSSESFWYDLTDGGYLEIDDYLTDVDQIKKVGDAIKLIQSLEQALDKAGLLEEM